jgi:hypothetical protein
VRIDSGSVGSLGQSNANYDNSWSDSSSSIQFDEDDQNSGESRIEISSSEKDI